MVDQLHNLPSPPTFTRAVRPPVPIELRKAVSAVTMALLAVTTAAWFIAAPLSVKVGGRGHIVASGEPLPIPGPISGRVLSLSAQIGQTVESGATIATVEPLVGGTPLSQVQHRRAELIAAAARLRGEIADAGKPEFPPSIADAAFKDLRDDETRRFADEESTLIGETAPLRATLRDENAERRNDGELLGRIDAEIAELRGQRAEVDHLSQRSFISSERHDDIERALSDVEKRKSALDAETAALDARISHDTSSLAALTQGFHDRTAKALEDVTRELADIEHRLDGAPKDGVAIVAAIDGNLTALPPVGAIVTAGKPIAGLKPRNVGDRAVIILAEAAAGRIHIDNHARIDLFDATGMPVRSDLPATVEEIHAVAEGMSVLLRLDPGDGAALNIARSGLVADVRIDADSRSALGQLLDSFDRH